jgi:DNA-binding winged helix-turn-helix (wHTH) protein/TolB-like protein/Tfp pilus assembly protein PilF
MISAVQDEKIYEFGDFRLIPGEDLLLHNGKQLTLNPKAFAVLALLVENHGHLVQKSEIIDQIWEGAFIEEGVISKSVWFIRSVLGDTSKEKFIQTVPRRGYRFVAPVTILNDPFRISSTMETISTGFRLPAPVEDAEPDAEFMPAKGHSAANAAAVATDIDAVSTGHSNLLRLSALILLLVAGATAAYLFYPRNTASEVGSIKSIAVLPFRPVNAANRDEGYEIGIAESLINRLSSTERLVVRPLSAVRRYADLELDPIAAGNEQKVDYVLAPYYQMADGKIRITAQLIDVKTGKTEESYDFAKNAAGLFALQDTVADELRSKLAVKFGTGSERPPTKRGTNNEEAYRLYQLAMTLVAKGGPVNIEAAIAYLDKVVTLDPNYARAWAGKAYSHTRRVWGPPGIPNREQIPKSLDAVQKALSIDPDLSEAYTVLCENRLFFEYDFDGAEAACKRAVELDQNSSVAHLASSRLLVSRGRSDEAFAEAKTAMDLDPASFVIQRQYANALYISGRYQEAEEQYRRAISLNPEEDGPYDQLIRTLDAQGKKSEAFECLIRWYEIRREGPERIEGLKAAYAVSGWHGAITELIRIIEARTTPNHYALAQWYATLGNKDKSLENLEKAFQERNLNMVLIRFADHHFISLRDDPRFIDLVRRIEGESQ